MNSTIMPTHIDNYTGTIIPCPSKSVLQPMPLYYIWSTALNFRSLLKSGRLGILYKLHLIYLPYFRELVHELNSSAHTDS